MATGAVLATGTALATLARARADAVGAGAIVGGGVGVAVGRGVGVAESAGVDVSSGTGVTAAAVARAWDDVVGSAVPGVDATVTHETTRAIESTSRR